MDLPTALRAWRERKGFSLRAAAERVGVSYQTIHQIEHGRKPSAPVAMKLASAMGVRRWHQWY